MIRIPLPSPDTHLLLSPRWGEIPLAAQVLLLVLCLTPVALVVWLYRYEMRLIRRRVALALLALRLVVLALLLFLFCFQPVWAHETRHALPGRVLIAVDRSDSLSVADPQRPAVEKLRLARALRLAGDLCPDDPARREELESERRHLHEEVCRRVDALTREEVARRVLTGDGVRLLPALAARHNVELMSFAREAWDVKSDQPDALFQKPADATATAFTDLRLPLQQALARSGPDRGKVLGVVLLTDGRHNWGESPVKAALELGEHKLPVYPVALGARQAPPDVALVGVTAPPAVFKDVDAAVEARFKVSGLPAQDVVVELRRPGQPPLEERIRHDGTDRYHTVRFQVRLDQPGAQGLTVAARPVPGEVRDDNGRRTVVVNVADDKARVLLIDGEARWEYHYLAGALARDRTVQLDRVVFAQPRLGRVTEDELLKSGNPRTALPTGDDPLSPFDCVILGDVSPAQLPSPERKRLEKYVADRGGTLVVLAGKRSMPLGFAGPGATDDPLAKLLPVEQPSAFAPEDGFSVALTEEGTRTGFLQMEQPADKNVARWAELPRHFWAVVGRPKPGAAPLALAGDKDQALIVRHNYGFGRVLFVGLDSTWRWRYKVGDLYHHRFWGQAVRWAASDKPLVTGNEHVRFGSRQPAYRQGQEAELVVRLADEVTPPRPDSLAGARILRKDGDKEEAVALVPLARREAQPRVLEGRVRDLPPGEYQVELVIPELADKLHGPTEPAGQSGKLRAGFAVTAPDGEEMAELATNWPLLEEMASKTGGRVFAPEDCAGLVELLTRQAATRTERTEHRLWQWWVTLVVLLALLTAEWAGRKWAGLP